MNLIKNNLKTIIAVIITMVFVASGTVYAVSAYFANDIKYNDITVADALDFLYDKVNQSINSWDFDYTGEVQLFKVPKTGVYKLEVWGAQGGTNELSNSPGGAGGYSSGYYYATEGLEMFVYVGGQGLSLNSQASQYGGWNGGGGIKASSFESTYDNYNGTGGGATDISLVYSIMTKNNETLRYERTEASYDGRIIVAGGGGGGGDLFYVKNMQGGAGGGLTGESYGGTQTGTTTPSVCKSILAPAGKGLGGTANAVKGLASHVGGGSGYYGGSSSEACYNIENTKTSGGGSGYIGGVTSYNGDEPRTLSGTTNFLAPDGKNITIGNKGNGYARITYVGE